MDRDQQCWTMLCGQDSFIVQVKLENVYGNLPEDVQIRFGTSKFEVNRPLPIGKNKKVIGTNKRWNGWKINERNSNSMTQDVQLPYDNHVDKKTKGTKKYVIKQEVKFQDNKTCLEKIKQSRIYSNSMKRRMTIYTGY